VRNTPIDEVFANWGPGGANTFAVPGLDQGAPAGSVDVVVNESVSDAQIGMSLGMPRDLDGDSFADNLDVSTTAQILPVIVQVSWASAPGTQENFRIPTLVFR